MLYAVIAFFVVCAAVMCLAAVSALRRAQRVAEKRIILIIPVGEDMTCAEGMLRDVLAVTALSGFDYSVMLCCTDSTGEVREICRRFSSDHGIFELCSFDTAEKLLHFP